MLDNETVREVREESYLSGEYLSSALEIQLERRCSTSSGSGGRFVLGRTVGTYFLCCLTYVIPGL